MKAYSNKTQFLKAIAERVQLREGAEGVEGVVRAIFEAQMQPGAEPPDERTLARIARLPMPVINALRWELQEAGALEKDGAGIRLSPDALQAVQEAWGWSSPEVAGQQSPTGAACKTCGGTGIAPAGGQWDAMLEGLRRHLKKPPLLPEMVLRRVAFMHESGALAGKDVLVLGDDVSVAIGVALAGKAFSRAGKLARRVVALHPDERVLSEVRDVAVREGVIVGLVRHDSRRSLLPDLEGEFDSVFVASSAVFSSLVNLLSRAIEAARPKDGIIYLLCPPLSLDDRVDIQRSILDMGLAIWRLVPGFSISEGVKGAKGGSDLYVLGVTEDSVVAEE